MHIPQCGRYTTCSRLTPGQIASAHCNNFAYWSRINMLAQPLSQPPLPAPPTYFNHSKTYVALVYGDMVRYSDYRHDVDSRMS